MDDLSGVIIGGIIAIAGTFIASEIDHWRVRKSLREAIRAEISAIITLTELRQYEAYYRGYLEKWKAGQIQDARSSIIGIEEEGWDRPERAAPVLHNNFDLPPLKWFSGYHRLAIEEEAGDAQETAFDRGDYRQAA